MKLDKPDAWIMGLLRFLIFSFFLSVVHSGQLYAAESTAPQYFRAVEQKAVERYTKFEARFRQFIQIVEASLAFRRDAKSLFNNLHRKLSSGGHLTSEEQQALKRKLTVYRKNYEELELVTGHLQRYSNSKLTIQFPVSEPTAIPETGVWTDDLKISINPSDDLGILVVLEIKMWLAARLIVLDNYVVVLSRYLKKDDVRRQFDLANIDPEAKAFLDRTLEQLSDTKKYERILKTIGLVQRIIAYEDANPAETLSRDKDNSYLNTLIEGSYAFRRIPQLSPTEKFAIETAATRNAFIDEITSLTNTATYEISQLFGNAIGLYEERKGKLFDMSPDQQKAVTDKLQPLDILFEKTPFRLTDRFIPGHWGHVAIWVGDKDDIAELKRLGVWEELPRIEAEVRSRWGYSGLSFQDLVQQGHGVLEALRPGVQLNPFANFLNIDDLAVIRDGDLTDERKKYYLLRAFSQVGKAYDFNFDIETHKRIVCSELAFVVYDDYDWSVQQSVGRYSVSPDHIAELALRKEDPFAPVVLFHDGKELPEQHHRRNFKSLLNGTYEMIEFN